MKKIIVLVLILSFFNGYLLSQDMKGSYYCSMKKSSAPDSYREYFLSTNNPKHSYDVLNYKLNLDIWNCFVSPYPKSFTATNHITLRVDSVLNNIKLNAVNTSLVIDSVKLLAGTPLTISHSSNILTVNLDRSYNPGEIVDIIIYYRHNNVADQGFYVYNGMVFTDCEPEGARKWFPCWDRPSDKATVDITVKTPSNVKLGSNGRLQDSTKTGDTIYYRWVSADPVATYITVLTGRVNYGLDIVYWHRLSNPADSIPIRLYYNPGENYTNIKNLMIPMHTYLSQKYSEYPFEKNGFATIMSGAGFTWGGMENQTLTSLCPNCWGEMTVLHECAHQWFGDMITCGTWADIWLNEGFATFSEAIWNERTGGYTAYKNEINSDANTYLNNNPGWAISVPDWAVNTPSNSVLFNYAITYCKGSCVLHLLRYVLGDTLFFNTIYNYATDTVNFRYKSAVIPDFVTKVNQETGQDLNWFFNQWIYQPNHPVYANSYNITDLGGGNWRINFVAKQTQTNTIPFYKMPVEIKFSFSTGSDTTVRVMNDVNNQLFSFYFNRQPTSVVFDPGNMIVLKQATLIMSTGENNLQLPGKFELKQNSPNPFNPVTLIEFSIPNNSSVKLTLYDVLGKEITTLINDYRTAGKYSENFNAMKLSSGVYFYVLEAGDFRDVKKMTLLK